MYLYLKNINHFKKMKGGEIFKYFGQCGRMFYKCTTLSHIAHNVLVYEMAGDLANGFQIEVYNSFD